MELPLFDEVADALSGLVPRELGKLRYRARRFGIKVWFEDETPPPEHYEAQVVSADHVEEATVTALEVGFHTEHPKEAENDAVIAHLLSAEPEWRPQIGDEAIATTFLGRGGWRRVSETWPDPDLDAAGLALEVAARLTDYVIAIEPVRRRRGPRLVPPRPSGPAAGTSAGRHREQVVGPVSVKQLRPDGNPASLLAGEAADLH